MKPAGYSHGRASLARVTLRSLLGCRVRRLSAEKRVKSPSSAQSNPLPKLPSGASTRV